MSDDAKGRDDRRRETEGAKTTGLNLRPEQTDAIKIAIKIALTAITRHLKELHEAGGADNVKTVTIVSTNVATIWMALGAGPNPRN